MAKALRCPFATFDPDGATPGGYMTPRVAILHVTTVERDSQSHGGLEWHFEIDLDGNIEQSVECNRQAAANYKANGFAISIETWGFGDGLWTAQQLAAILKLLRWLNVEWGIPLRVCPAWDSSGVGYHIQFGTPGYWTNVAKACPGKNRIKQFWDVIVPALVNGTDIELPTITEGEAVASVFAMYLLYLGITQDEIMNSPTLRRDVSYHCWQITSGQVTEERKRADLEAWATAQNVYPTVGAAGWWK